MWISWLLGIQKLELNQLKPDFKPISEKGDFFQIGFFEIFESHYSTFRIVHQSISPNEMRSWKLGECARCRTMILIVVDREILRRKRGPILRRNFVTWKKPENLQVVYLAYPPINQRIPQRNDLEMVDSGRFPVDFPFLCSFTGGYSLKCPVFCPKIPRFRLFPAQLPHSPPAWEEVGCSARGDARGGAALS